MRTSSVATSALLGRGIGDLDPLGDVRCPTGPATARHRLCVNGSRDSVEQRRPPAARHRAVRRWTSERASLSRPKDVSTPIPQVFPGRRVTWTAGHAFGCIAIAGSAATEGCAAPKSDRRHVNAGHRWRSLGGQWGDGSTGYGPVRRHSAPSQIHPGGGAKAGGFGEAASPGRLPESTGGDHGFSAAGLAGGGGGGVKPIIGFALWGVEGWCTCGPCAAGGVGCEGGGSSNGGVTV